MLSLWYRITILHQDATWGALALGPSNIEVQGDAREGSKPSNNALPGPPSKTIKYDLKAPYLPTIPSSIHHITPSPPPHARGRFAAPSPSHARSLRRPIALPREVALPPHRPPTRGRFAAPSPSHARSLRRPSSLIHHIAHPSTHLPP